MHLLRPLFLATATVCLSVVASAALTVGSALSLFDNDVRNYNLISFGNATFTNYGDTEGALAVGGNLSLNGGAVSTKSTLASDPTLYVAGKLSVTGTTYLNTGYASISQSTNSGWTWNAQQNTLSQSGSVFSTINTSNPLGDIDPRKNAAISGWSFSSVRTDLVTVSQTLASASTNGTISVSSGNLLFTPTSSSTHGAIVFTLDLNLLSGSTYNGKSFSNIQLNVPTGDTFIINVVHAKNGSTLFGTGVNFNAGSGYDRLLWNFVDTTPTATDETINLGNGGQFYGSVLAATWNVTNSGSTAINGQVVADTFTCSNSELHFTSFDELETPEPSTYGLCGAGLLGALVLLRRCARR